MSSTATQRSLLLALSGVSLAALFIWYLQSKKTRRTSPIENVKRSKNTEELDNNEQKNRFTSTAREVSPSEQEKKVVEKPVESEQEQCRVLVSDTQLNAGSLIMTTSLETVSASEVDSSPIPVVNGFAKEANEIDISWFTRGTSQRLYKKKSCGKKTDEIVNQVEIRLSNEEAPKKEPCHVKDEEKCQEKQVLEEMTDLQQQLILDVSHQAEPEVFSWSDEMERSYEESRRKEEEERQQQENSAVNGSGDYTTSDSPGLASQNSELHSVSQYSGKNLPLSRSLFVIIKIFLAMDVGKQGSLVACDPSIICIPESRAANCRLNIVSYYRIILRLHSITCSFSVITALAL
ncbi:hypothetical protein RB195_009384 [Necator americanus]|uniref:Ig-like domain-containing protein n=1 Tax=Necator americanus TaxID=51031 RepID=A0ABR1CT41_NECAM